MIHAVSDYPGNGMTVSEYRRQHLRRFYERPQSNFLREQTDQTLRELERRKEQGIKPEKVWTLDYEIKFTRSFADVFGF